MATTEVGRFKLPVTVDDAANMLEMFDHAYPGSTVRTYNGMMIIEAPEDPVAAATSSAIVPPMTGPDGLPLPVTVKSPKLV